ncbi:MAG: DUF3667 domain-containing protein [Bacteroidota bacterium]
MEAQATDLKKCFHCGAEQLEFPHCPYCGEKAEPQQLKAKAMVRDWWSKRLTDIKIFYLTCKDMLLRPGTVIKSYWDGPRGKYYQPFNFFMVIASIIAFTTITFSPEVDFEEILRKNQEAMQLSPMQPDASEMSEEQKATMENVQRRQTQFMIWVQKHFNLILLAFLPIFVLGVYLLFRKNGRTYGEQFILSFYMSGTSSLLVLPIYFVSNPFDGFDPIKLVALFIAMFFFSWTYRDLYKFSWGKSLWKGGMTQVMYILLILGFIIIVGILGLIIGIVAASIMRNFS